MNKAASIAGQYNPCHCDLFLNRLGYGAMQLTGPHVWGPPKNRAAAVAVLRTAVEHGVNHIDTADFYGPHITNEIIREALAPYSETLTIATKIGYVRGSDQSWQPASTSQQLREAVHENLRRLGLDVLDLVYFRAPGNAAPDGRPVGDAIDTLMKLRQEGLIRHIGLSNATTDQVAEARALAPIVAVQNQYNLAHRGDEALIATLAAAGIAYVPFFPLGGFSPLQSETLSHLAKRLDATPMQVALAWLLQRSPNILVIPGTSSVAHLRENLDAGALKLGEAEMKELEAF